MNAMTTNSLSSVAALAVCALRVSHAVSVQVLPLQRATAMAAPVSLAVACQKSCCSTLHTVRKTLPMPMASIDLMR
jgi:ABC-type uncharacterized transport system involved in gliding motility auxiliary subunit